MKKGNIWMAAMLVAAMCTGCGNQGKETFREAEQNLLQGNYEAALEGFKEAVSEDVKVAQAWRGQGLALLRQNQYEEAIAAFDTALIQDGTSRSFKRDNLLYKGTAQYHIGDSDGALASCDEAIQQGEDAQVYLLKGDILVEKAEYDSAKEAFQTAVSIENEYDTYVQVYQTYAKRDMQADGEAFLQEALTLKGSSAEDSYQRGRIYYYMGDSSEAKAELTEASAKDNLEADLFLGKIYLDEGNVENARGIYQNYITKAENPGQGYNGLALCALEEKLYDDALSYISQGMDVAQTDEVQDLMYNEIVAYEGKLDFATALEKMEAYLKLYPEDQEALREYKFLQNR